MAEVEKCWNIAARQKPRDSWTSVFCVSSKHRSHCWLAVGLLQHHHRITQPLAEMWSLQGRRPRITVLDNDGVSAASHLDVLITSSHSVTRASHADNWTRLRAEVGDRATDRAALLRSCQFQANASSVDEQLAAQHSEHATKQSDRSVPPEAMFSPCRPDLISRTYLSYEINM